MIDLRAEMEATAERLTGKVILLQFREPPTRGASGECYKTDSGLIYIDLSPALGLEETYRVFLHETAHAKLHAATVKPTPEHLTYSGAIEWQTYPAQVQAVADRSEAEADTLAASWASWADRMTSKALQSNDSIMAHVIAKLTALQFYKE